MNPKQQVQQDPLNLRSLPPVTPEQDGWPAIEQALLARSRRGRGWKAAGATLAAAATVVLALVLWLGNTPQLQTGDAPALSAEQTAPAVPSSEKTLKTLMALSQQLEGQLHRYRSEMGDLPSGLLIYQVELQDLVAQVDEEISANPRSLDLWSQRVNLLVDISQLYESSLRRDYHQMASLLADP